MTRLHNAKGLTLVELTTTVVVASLAAGIMMGGYQMVSRSLRKHHTAQQAQATAWTAYKRLSRLIRNSVEVKSPVNGKWIMRGPKGDSTVVTQRKDTLAIDGRAIEGALVFSCAPGASKDVTGVLQCTVTCSTRKSARTIRWRSIPLGHEQTDGLTSPRLAQATLLPPWDHEQRTAPW